MEFSPDIILEDFRKKRIDKNYAIEQLISLIDNSNDDIIRLGALVNLLEIRVVSEEMFRYLENLFISDLNAKIRLCAVNYLKTHYINKILSLMKWAINHESDYKCLIAIINILMEINTLDSKKILIENIKNIKDIKYLDDIKRIENKKFRKAIKNLLKSKKIKNLTHSELADILINYLTISELTKKFYSVYFELEQNLVSKLDLADVEYEVRGWKADFKNNIKEISEITGLENLKHLKHLNISNNQIKNIQDLIQLKNLTHLYLSNNQIQNLINLEYIKNMPKLKYIDLAGNQITDNLTSDSIMNIKINLRKYYK